MPEVHTNKKAFKAGVWYTISNIMIKAISIITVPIYTRMLSTSEYGLVSIFNSWYVLLLIICSLDLDLSIGRAKQDFHGKLSEYIGSMQVLSALFSIILFSIVFIFIEPISNFMELNKILIILLAIYLFFSVTISLVQAQYRYEYKYKENIYIMFFIAISTASISLVLIYLLDDEKYMGKIWGTVMPMILLGCIYWYKGFKNKLLKMNKIYWKYALIISVPMIIHSLSINLLAQSNIVIIAKYLNTESVGIYTLAYQYAVLLSIVMNSINQAWQPWFHDNYFAKKFFLIKEKTKTLTIFTCFLGICSILITPEAIYILGSESFKDGMWAVPIIVIALICDSMYRNYINIELHVKRTKYASYGTIIAAAINIILAMIFIPRYGFLAGAYTILLSYILLLGIHFFITRYILKIRLYDDKFFIYCILVMCILSTIVMMLFNYFIIRMIILVIVMFLFIINNKNLIMNFRKNKI